MILAAGRGSRMGTLSDDCPKVLLPLNGKAIIDYHLEHLAGAGVTDVVINVHYLGEQIKRHVGDGQQFGVSVHYSEEHELLGPGGGVHQALPLLGEQPFIVVGGDMWTDYAYQHLPKEIAGEAHIVLVDNPTFHPEGDFQLHGQQVLDKGEHNFNYAGFGVYRPEFYQADSKGSYALSALFARAIADDAVTGEYYDGIWANLNTPEQLTQLSDKLSLLEVKRKINER